jgi:gamma-glutamyltranspeptidase/glutathione hydrolase
MPKLTTRPIIMGRRAVVTSGHYLATAAGFRMFEQGGNAVDAAAAMGFCLTLLEPHNCSLGGEVPILVYSAQDQRAYAISGQGWSPRAFTIEWCQAHGIDLIPGDGFLPACVPAVVGSWVLALARFGTFSLQQVLQPVIELAENGFPLYEELQEFLASQAAHFAEHYPTTYALYYPQGRIPEIGELLRNPDLARTLRRLCEAEARAQGRGRVGALETARQAFYQEEIPDQICQFITSQALLDASGDAHIGLLTPEDLAGWRAEVEEPVMFPYRGLEVHKCSTWTQGPVFLQQLAILEGYDLRQMGHNSTDYLHTWIECAKLAFADREAYYGDPRLDQVPLDDLLSREYAAERRALIGARASLDMRPGKVGEQFPEYATRPVLEDHRRVHSSGHVGDTTHLDAVDGAGNMVAATPSGGWIQSSPVIPGLGFPLGTRGQMFYLNPERPNALAPHKRPRTTLTPSLVTRQSQPYLVFGTPGGDSQDQWTLQFFLNYVDFELDLQSALDAPTVHSLHFPSSFYPRAAFPGLVEVERSVSPEVVEGLRRRGHEIRVVDDWQFGKVMGIRYDQEKGIISGGVAPKGVIGYALGW